MAESTGDTRMAVRMDSIEVVRVVAACGVIWAHLPGLARKEIGHAGLICFILVSVVFQARSAGRRRLARQFTERLRRLARPWLFWFAFYLAANTLRGGEAFPYSEGAAANLLTGPWIGLWYLPFILLVSPLVHALGGLVARLPPMAAAAACLGAAATLWSTTRHFPSIARSGAPWSQWSHAAAAIPFGIALASVLRAPHANRAPAMACVLALALALCAFLPDPGKGSAAAYGIALPMVGAALLVRAPLPRGLVKLGSLCLGVYLLHPVAIAVLKRMAPLSDHPPLLFGAVVLGSFTAVALLRTRQALARFL